MTPLDYTLLNYARLYVRNAPRSATHEIPELRPLELKIVELTGDTDWYCDQWPGKNAVVFFYDAGDARGTTSQHYVDLDDNTVVTYAR